MHSRPIELHRRLISFPVFTGVGSFLGHLSDSKYGPAQTRTLKDVV